EHVDDVSKAALSHCVINRTAIHRCVDDSTKYRRHFIRALAHVTLVQSAQPQFSDDPRENQNQSNDGGQLHETIELPLLSESAHQKLPIMAIPITLKALSGIVIPFEV